MVGQKVDAWIERDPFLEPYRDQIRGRRERSAQLEERLTGEKSLREFATGHEYYGLHKTSDGWVFREWAPNADKICLIGEMNNWQESPEYTFTRLDDGESWELSLKKGALSHGQLFRLRMYWPGGSGERLPAWTRRVVQDAETLVFNAQVWAPEKEYQWEVKDFSANPTMIPFIYEAHVGMAQEEGRVGTFREFADNIIPRIVAAGYNSIQLMAVQEHPYYGSFGYQVGNFFAPSSRFGTPEDLKYLVDTAHKAGLAVIMDIVHSHAVSNEVEGIARYDGTQYQFFHDGEKGHHKAWDSKCFDYAKPQVIHFLLSNIRYWLEEYKFDGLRFDGVTSMMYHDHGLERVFTGYHDYFDHGVDEDAVAYLMLATRIARQVKPGAILIAEDVSGMPGLAVSQEEGGLGFSYRFAMGVADHWIRLVKDHRDEDWEMSWLWHELVNRRQDEKTISYTESHDQSLVGDQTLAFRLIGPDIYWHMDRNHQTMAIDRGIALHKMIRLITLGAAGHGYMNFIGNEFGHPEWVDFPREGNNWSYSHARRQWSLVDNDRLRYGLLGDFDRAMITLMRENDLLHEPDIYLKKQHEDDKVLAFQRNGFLFVFNFHPEKSFTDYWIQADAGSYDIVLDTDSHEFGGFNRRSADQEILSFNAEGTSFVSLYLPSRTGVVLAKRGQPKPIVAVPASMKAPLKPKAQPSVQAKASKAEAKPELQSKGIEVSRTKEAIKDADSEIQPGVENVIAARETASAKKESATGGSAGAARTKNSRSKSSTTGKTSKRKKTGKRRPKKL